MRARILVLPGLRVCLPIRGLPRRTRSRQADQKAARFVEVATPSISSRSQMPPSASCTFCQIVSGQLDATVVREDEHTIAFLDLRQFHAGHVLVIPREHVADIRDARDELAAAILVAVARVARAVDAAFPNDGLSVWHSAGAGAKQEVPHLHFHVHPRYIGDDLLRVYPSAPAGPDRVVLETWGKRLRAALDDGVPAAT